MLLLRSRRSWRSAPPACRCSPATCCRRRRCSRSSAAGVAATRPRRALRIATDRLPARSRSRRTRHRASPTPPATRATRRALQADLRDARLSALHAACAPASVTTYRHVPLIAYATAAAGGRDPPGARRRRRSSSRAAPAPPRACRAPSDSAPLLLQPRRTATRSRAQPRTGRSRQAAGRRPLRSRRQAASRELRLLAAATHLEDLHRVELPALALRDRDRRPGLDALASHVALQADRAAALRLLKVLLAQPFLHFALTVEPARTSLTELGAEAALVVACPSVTTTLVGVIAGGGGARRRVDGRGRRRGCRSGRGGADRPVVARLVLIRQAVAVGVEVGADVACARPRPGSRARRAR